MNITNFVKLLEARLNEYKTRAGYTYFDSYTVFATEKQKYFKIFAREVKDGTGRNERLVAFIDKATGDILKPASFNTPAKHSRGNINSAQSGMEAIDPSGNVYYLRG